VIGAKIDNVGGVVSTTVTEEDPFATSPATSVAVHVNVFVPSAKARATPVGPKSQLTTTAPDPPLVWGAGGVNVADSLLVASTVIGLNIVMVSGAGPLDPPHADRADRIHADKA
jgi:hypothetical protein